MSHGRGTSPSACSLRLSQRRGRVDDPERVQLMARNTFPKDELRPIRPVQAVDTVRSADTILESDRITIRRTGLPSAEQSRRHERTHRSFFSLREYGSGGGRTL